MWDYDIHLLYGPVFNCPKQGLMEMIDNKIRSLQSKRMHTESHNTVSQDDLFRLFRSQSLSKKTAPGFQARIIFIVSLLTAMRPSALEYLSANQSEKVRIDGKLVWKIVYANVSSSGAVKGHREGWDQNGKKPLEVCVFD